MSPTATDAMGRPITGSALKHGLRPRVKPGTLFERKVLGTFCMYYRNTGPEAQDWS